MQTKFHQAVVAVRDGRGVRVRDPEGRLGSVLAVTDEDALVFWDRGYGTRLRADRFQRLHLILVDVVPPADEPGGDR